MYGLTSLAVLAAGALSFANARPLTTSTPGDYYSPTEPELLPAATEEATSSYVAAPSNFGRVNAYASTSTSNRASANAPYQTFDSAHRDYGQRLGGPRGSGRGPAPYFPTASGNDAAYGTGRTGPTGTGVRPTGAYSTGLGATGISTYAPVPSMIRGVNLGGWLILEKWMTPDLFKDTGATDQWSFDQTDGAARKLKHHWDTYITEKDIQKLPAWGINAVRIPIGYWAYKSYDSGYLQGADAYLEKAIGWCRKAGIKVMVDCHGSVGSQNGFDNSGRNGSVLWQSKEMTNGTTNMQKSIEVLKIMAQKYGSMEYADTVYAFEVVNEPITWNQNSPEATQEWAIDAYDAVRSVAANKDMIVVMHDGFMNPHNWTDVGATINGNSSQTPLADSRFAIDVHLYRNQATTDSEVDQDEHIKKACGWTKSQLLPRNSNLPVYVGEFSTQTNICAMPDGNTIAGSSCSIDGCQCSSNVDPQYWKDGLRTATRKFVEAELDAFEHSSQGWFMWTLKGPGAWGLENAVKYGLIGEKVTDRKYPNQCNF